MFITLQRFLVSILGLHSGPRGSAASQSSGRGRRLRRGALLAGALLAQCVVATGTCNKQCDKIVADVQEIHYETNTTIKVKIRHPDKV
jgi:hypothetical protein